MSTLDKARLEREQEARDAVRRAAMVVFGD